MVLCLLVVFQVTKTQQDVSRLGPTGGLSVVIFRVVQSMEDNIQLQIPVPIIYILSGDYTGV